MPNRDSSSLRGVRWGFWLIVLAAGLLPLGTTTAARGQALTAEPLGPMPDSAHLVMSVVSGDCRNVSMIVNDSPGKSTLLLNGKGVASGLDIPVAAISPDGKRLAYVVNEGGGRWHVVIDGVASETYDARLDQMGPAMLGFSPDGKHFAYVGKKGGNIFPRPATLKEELDAGLHPTGKEFVVMDGVAGSVYPNIEGLKGEARGPYVLLSEQGGHYAYVGDNGDGWDLVCDGKVVGATEPECGFCFSKDGRRFAAVLGDSLAESAVLLDGQKLGHYDVIDDLAFSDDGKHFAFAVGTIKPGTLGGTTSLVVDGVQGPPVVEHDSHNEESEISQMTFSPDGKRIAFDQESRTFANGRSFESHHVSLDGVEGHGYGTVDHLTFSPDGTRLAYVAIKRWQANEPADNCTIVVNGAEGRGYTDIRAPVFSPDGRHLAYSAKDGDTWYMMLDGTALPMVYDPVLSSAVYVPAPLERQANAPRYACAGNFATPYRFDSDGRLIYLAVRDGQICRVTCRPDVAAAAATP